MSSPYEKTNKNNSNNTTTKKKKSNNSAGGGNNKKMKPTSNNNNSPTNSPKIKAMQSSKRKLKTGMDGTKRELPIEAHGNPVYEQTRQDMPFWCCGIHCGRNSRYVCGVHIDDKFFAALLIRHPPHIHFGVNNFRFLSLIPSLRSLVSYGTLYKQNKKQYCCCYIVNCGDCMFNNMCTITEIFSICCITK